MTILGEKLAEIEAALEIGQAALIELHRENEALKDELEEANHYAVSTVAQEKIDEWKRRALEAEGALKKAADIFSDMIEHGRIDTESTPYSYYVPEGVLEQIYAPLQNVPQSDKKREL